MRSENSLVLCVLIFIRFQGLLGKRTELCGPNHGVDFMPDLFVAPDHRSWSVGTEPSVRRLGGLP